MGFLGLIRTTESGGPRLPMMTSRRHQPIVGSVGHGLRRYSGGGFVVGCDALVFWLCREQKSVDASTSAHRMTVHPKNEPCSSLHLDSIQTWSADERRQGVPPLLGPGMFPRSPEECVLHGVNSLFALGSSSTDAIGTREALLHLVAGLYWSIRASNRTRPNETWTLHPVLADGVEVFLLERWPRDWRVFGHVRCVHTQCCHAVTARGPLGGSSYVVSVGGRPFSEERLYSRFRTGRIPWRALHSAYLLSFDVAASVLEPISD